MIKEIYRITTYTMLLFIFCFAYKLELLQSGLACVQLEDVLGEAHHSLVQLVDVDALLLRVVRHGRGGAPPRVKAHPRLIISIHHLALFVFFIAFFCYRVELFYIYNQKLFTKKL